MGQTKMKVDALLHLHMCLYIITMLFMLWSVVSLEPVTATAQSPEERYISRQGV